jgi:hypothetical protein
MPTGSAINGSSTDPSGIPVVLFQRTWRRKILRDHPEMRPFAGAVLQAVVAPDFTIQDPVFEGRKRFYSQNAGPSRWLLVVISYEQEPARIISAFGNRKGPPSWST